MSDHLLPRFHRRAIEAADRRRIAAIIVESGESIPLMPGAGMHADPIRLRGIPVVGGATGAIPGSDPLGELLRRERPLR